MLLDVRIYTCRPGTIKKHLEIYERYGKAPQTRHLGPPLAYMTTETGNPNQYIHIWVYENAGDRETKRAAMWADPAWIKYTQESAKLGALVSQENKLMSPVAFFAEPKAQALPAAKGARARTAPAKRAAKTAKSGKPARTAKARASRK